MVPREDRGPVNGTPGYEGRQNNPVDGAGTDGVRASTQAKQVSGCRFQHWRMDVIDENGRLFGVVNVVDALVVLLVLAVAATGAVVVFQPEPESPPLRTVNATLDLGAEPDYIVEAVNRGDSYAPTSRTRITITDVYFAPQGNQTGVVLKTRLRGPGANDTITYREGPPRLGRQLTIRTDTYDVAGNVTSIGGDPTFDTSTREVLVETTLDAETAARIEDGDEFTVRERRLGTVRSVTAYGTNDPDRKRVLVGLALQTRESVDVPRFAGEPLHEGVSIPFRTGSYRFTGEVRRVGASEPRGELTTRTVTLQLRDVPPRLANSIRVGMAETTVGETIAKIIEVNRQNATVVLVSESGNIYEREHPINQDLTITAELRVRETPAGVRFKGRTIQQGDSVVLDLQKVTVNATVVAT